MPSRNIIWLAAAGLALGLLTGCESSSDSDSSAQGQERVREGEVEVDWVTPPTFVTGAAWEASSRPEAPVQVTERGVLTFSAQSGQDTYAATLLDVRTGDPTWVSRAIRSPEAEPVLALTYQDGRPWVMMVAIEGDTASVYSYDPMLGGERIRATASVAYQGKDGEPPEVVIGERGVLVLGSDVAPALQYRPDTGTDTIYGNGPTRLEEPGSPIQVYDDGWLVTYSEGGFAYATETLGWDSARIAPDGVDRAGGRIVAISRGLLLVDWPSLTGGAENRTLWLHDLRTGEPLVEFDADESLIEEQSEAGLPLVASRERTDLSWGEVIFDMDARQAQQLDLRGGTVTAISQDILYVEGASEPFPLLAGAPPVLTREQIEQGALPQEDAASTSGSSSTSDEDEAASTTPADDAAVTSAVPEDAALTTAPGDQETVTEPARETASSEPRIDPLAFSGYAAVYAETGEALPGEMENAPIGFTDQGQAIFVTSSEGAVFAVTPL